MRKNIIHILVFAILAGSACAEAARIREVGPKKKYRTPCQAIASAAAGDTIEINAAGKYSGDVCAFEIDNLTIRGVNGRPKIDAAGASSHDKGIWVIGGDNNLIENIELTGAKSSSKNGSGIRLEKGSLTVRDCYFHDNEDGILTASDPASHVLIEYSEFADNGNGDGYSHNMYIGHIGKFTLRYSYSHDAREGHLVKSRATENYILYNRLSTETAGTSYELDLPNGGLSYVIGNVIYQGQSSVNGGIMTYQVEGPHQGNPGSALYVINNTFVNTRTPEAQFITTGAGLTTPPVIQNNIFTGSTLITNFPNAKVAGNVVTSSPGFTDAAKFDYRLQSGSPAIDAGVDLPADLRPAMHYLHPACSAGRTTVGRVDAGAYEFGGIRAMDGPSTLPDRCRQLKF